MQRDDALKAMDIPDLAPIVDLQLSRAYAMESLVDGILNYGRYQTPDEWFDPVALFDYSLNRYMLALSKVISHPDAYPEGHMSDMRKLLDFLKPRADQARQAAAAPPPGTAPPGGGMPAGASPEAIQAQATPAAPMAA
jgi:hypothetical protein